MSITFIDLAKKVIHEEKRPLSCDEIWEIVLQRGYDKDLNTSGKTPGHTLGAQVYVAARDKRHGFYKIGARPAKFYLDDLPEPVDTLPHNDPRNELPERKKLLEKNLHPHLAFFAQNDFAAYCKTIQHTKSDKRDYGEWVHPDMVGAAFPHVNLSTEVFELGSVLGAVPPRLFSFEIKRKLSFANLRESFFQAVSNSSWANEGYLVTSDLSLDEEFRYEIERLSSAFGIGIIQLEIDDPPESQVFLPARRKSQLDLETMDKLSEMNSDFREFLRRIRMDFTSREVRKEMYDAVPELQQLTSAK